MKPFLFLMLLILAGLHSSGGRADVHTGTFPLGSSLNERSPGTIIRPQREVPPIPREIFRRNLAREEQKRRLRNLEEEIHSTRMHRARSRTEGAGQEELAKESRKIQELRAKQWRTRLESSWNPAPEEKFRPLRNFWSPFPSVPPRD